MLRAETHLSLVVDTTGIRGEDDERPPEIEKVAVNVFHLAVINDLKEKFADSRPGLFEFIKQHDAFGEVTNSGKNASLSACVPDVARRHTQEAVDGWTAFLRRTLQCVAIDANKCVLTASKNLCQHQSRLGLAHTRWPSEKEYATRSGTFGPSAHCRHESTGDVMQHVVLTDDFLPQ